MDFEKQSYWHERFSTETNFEWLVPSPVFLEVLTPVFQSLSITPSTTSLLHLGFGTSDLQTHFRRQGFQSVVNMDYEPLALERGRHLETQAFGDVKMDYRLADVSLPSWPGAEDTGRYHLVIDKCAADAVSCGGDEAVATMCQGVRKCLAPKGVWISLSYSATRFDAPGLLLPFDVEVLHKFPTPKLKPNDPDIYHYCYLLRPRSS